MVTYPTGDNENTWKENEKMKNENFIEKLDGHMISLCALWSKDLPGIKFYYRIVESENDIIYLYVDKQVWYCLAPNEINNIIKNDRVGDIALMYFQTVKMYYKIINEV